MTRKEALLSMSSRELAEILVDSGGACTFCSENADYKCTDLMDCIKHVEEWLDEKE